MYVELGGVLENYQFSIAFAKLQKMSFFAKKLPLKIICRNKYYQLFKKAQSS